MVPLKGQIPEKDQRESEATPQLIRITAKREGCQELFFPKKRKCPYQAIVMKSWRG